uniref:Fatty acid hydroxylase domain-containing protein n=1 Tax=Chlamydomonas euryale TaxID=1486919 RepID=A0A7R9YUX7_9CHLO|mmetsp:Transcript_25597/g.75668  ORF Transcript_25597/g.75668 Transcript_25597/m.75668 type:complete len:144 (+) Transcript_25597:372-803(+)
MSTRPTCHTCHTQGGHAGYEIAPFIPTAAGLASLLMHGPSAQPPAGLNTVRHHDMHHRFPGRHFSLYFTHWDRWLGTLHPDYDASVSRHFREAKSEAGGVGTCAGEEDAGCVVKRGTGAAAGGAEPALRTHSARSANGAGSPK